MFDLLNNLKETPYLIDPEKQDGKKVKFLMPQIKREDLAKYPEKIVETWGIDFAHGGYSEERKFYFGEVQNTVFTHAGVDLFFDPDLDIYAPFDCEIISLYWSMIVPYKPNQGSGGIITLKIEKEELFKFYKKDYVNKIMKDDEFLIMHLIHLDPSIIFNINGYQYEEIQIEDKLFWLPKNFKEKKINAGTVIAKLGKEKENGGWRQHLHIETRIVNSYDKYQDLESLKSETSFLNSVGVINGDSKEFRNNLKINKLVSPYLFFNFDENSKIENMTIKPYSKK
ncbi:hypothetical protein CJJ23_00215 [Mycoplasmopsis agassizii]|uniref:Peptidase M23 domain-containing protein n=1 Tax=Mycoplasmopsis agassizii TaxID=33922 RepID=A0A269TLW5_9BACT|nr:hypothetical protein [Mycoplasmopsis agassizii]PAK21755.1 hypothetical protein CJJ23_00215 [Mycoplasmopsis agassizii]